MVVIRSPVTQRKPTVVPENVEVVEPDQFNNRCSCCVLPIFTVVPLLFIAIGLLYQDDCPRNNHIPRYLTVDGILLVLKVLAPLYKGTKVKKLRFVLDSIYLLWHLWGLAILNKAGESSLACDAFLYGFAYWTLLIKNIILAVTLY